MTNSCSELYYEKSIDRVLRIQTEATGVERADESNELWRSHPLTNSDLI